MKNSFQQQQKKEKLSCSNKNNKAADKPRESTTFLFITDH